jgi:hypothetical protein
LRLAAGFVVQSPTAGLPHRRPESIDKLPLHTTSDDLAHLAQFLPPDRDAYTAADLLPVVLTPRRPHGQFRNP